jgi:hypothetical protein
MYRMVSLIVVCGMFMIAGGTEARNTNAYLVKRASEPLVIDGMLDEAAWRDAELTGNFLIYTDSSDPEYGTQAKMLWDDDYLYIAVIMTDRDVWAEMTSWGPDDRCLCSEEVAEVFIDPDGDGSMYIEIEVNPFETVMDLTVSKALAEGGKADMHWKFEGLKVGVEVYGTLNESSDYDKKWVCEMALPFKAMAFSAPTKNFPPEPSDTWRLNVYRYNYDRNDIENPELSAWNPTGLGRGFHAPNKFGCVIFSDEVSPAPK